MYTSPRSTQACFFESSWGLKTFDASTSVPRVRVSLFSFYFDYFFQIVTVSIPRTIGDPCAPGAGLGLNEIADEINAQIFLIPGVNQSNYDSFVYFTPAFCGIGVAFIGGSQSFINDFNSDTLAHEVNLFNSRRSHDFFHSLATLSGLIMLLSIHKTSPQILKFNLNRASM